MNKELQVLIITKSIINHSELDGFNYSGTLKEEVKQKLIELNCEHLISKIL